MVRLIITSILCFVAGFFVCKFTIKPEIKEKIVVQEKIIYKEKQKNRIIKKPDGTVIKETIVSNTHAQEKEQAKEVKQINTISKNTNWLIGYTYDVRSNTSGIQIQKEIVPHIYTGIQSDGKAVMLSIGIGF